VEECYKRLPGATIDEDLVPFNAIQNAIQDTHQLSPDIYPLITRFIAADLYITFFLYKTLDIYIRIF